MKDFRFSRGTKVKHRPKHVPDVDAAFIQLAAIQRNEPGKLDSWLRAQRPMPTPTTCAHFVSTVDLWFRSRHRA